MIFLNPAVLFGLIAAGIPVLLHFLNLQRMKKIEFSTLIFLKELQKTKIRKLKFKQWLLLLLRVLLILLLVAAFARPTLESVNLGGSSAAKTTSIYILDNSYSMSAVSGNGSYFNNSKQVIQNLVSQLQQGDEAVLILVSGNEKPVMGLSSVISEVENSSISVITPDYKSVFEQAKTVLDNSDNFNKEVYIFSDFQKLITDIDTVKAQKYFDENTRTYLFDYGNGNLSNVSLTSMKLENQILEPGKPLTFTATVTNLSDEGSGNKVASLFLNGVRSAQQSFNLQLGGSQSLSFNAVLKEPGLVKASVQIEDDDIQYDNERFVLFDVPDEINVLLLTDKKEDGIFVKTALMSVSENAVIKITEDNLSSVNSSLLEKNKVIVIAGSKNFRNGTLLKNYVENGGSVVIFPGSSSQLNDFQNLTAAFGIPAPVSRPGRENDSENPVFFDKVEYDSPIFTGLFENQKDVKVESPDIYTYFKINPSGIAKPIISLTDNSLFLSEYSLGNGRVLLFNSAPLLSWNNFPVKSLFAPLMNKIVLYQSSGGQLGQDITAGKGINISIQNLAYPQLKIVRPDNTEEFINPGELENNRFLDYNNTAEPGGYELYSGNELVDYASVNFNPEESLSGYLEHDEIEKFMADICSNDEYVFVEPEGNYLKEIQQARFGTELWNYFLIAALIIALIEMFVSKSAKKDITEIKQHV